MKGKDVFKKIISAILILGLALNPFSGLLRKGADVQAVEFLEQVPQVEGNLFTEGDFEVEVSPFGTNGGGSQVMTQVESHTGQFSLRVGGQGGRASVHYMEPGATYRLMFWTKTTEGASWSLQIHRWQSDGLYADSSLGVTSENATKGTTVNGWTQWSYEFQMGIDQNYMQFDVRTNSASNYVYYDDISVAKIKDSWSASLNVSDSESYVVENDMEAAPRTFEFWLESSGNPDGSLIDNFTTDLSADNNYGASYGVRITNGHPFLWWWAGSGQGPQIRLEFHQVELPTNEKVHIAIVSDSANNVVRCYLNGELAQTLTVSDYKASQYYSWGGAAFGSSYNQIKTETITHAIGATRPLVLGGDTEDTSTLTGVKLYSVAAYADERAAKDIKLDMNRVEYTEESLLLAYDFSGVGNEGLEDHSNHDNHLVYTKNHLGTCQYNPQTAREIDVSFTRAWRDTESDNSWKFESPQLDSMTSEYYTVPASVDGKATKDILIQKYDDHLCIWGAGFFNGPSGDNGFGVPTSSFTIAKGAIFKPVEYVNGWVETGARGLALANTIHVVYDSNAWVSTDIELTWNYVREDNYFNFTWSTDIQLAPSAWYAVEATIETENGFETRNVMFQIDRVADHNTWIYAQCFGSVPGNSLIPTKSFKIAKGAAFIPINEDENESPNASLIDATRQVLYVSDEIYLRNEGSDYSGWQQTASVYVEHFDESGLAFDVNEQYIAEDELRSIPQTYEAVINLPKELGSNEDCMYEYAGIIAGNYADTYNINTAYVNFEVHTDGHPSLIFNQKAQSYRAIFDQVDVRTGEWLHLAVTVDTSNYNVHCYVDGVLAQTVNYKAASGATQAVFPTSASAKESGWKHLIIGGDYRRTNAKYFRGKIQSFATFYDVRTAAEIQADSTNMKALSDSNLAQSYHLTYKDYDSLTRNQRWIREVDVPTKDEYDYSMIVLGDTQCVSYYAPQYFPGYYDYVLERAKEDESLAFCVGVGDMTEKGQVDWEYKIVAEQLKRLDGVVPYSVIRGNHEWDPYLVKYLPYENFKDMYEGAYDTDDAHESLYIENGYYGGSILNNWQTFKAGDTDYLMLGLDYFPRDDELAWAKHIVDSHPNHNVIITTHGFLYINGELLDTSVSENLDGYVAGDSGYASETRIWNQLVSQCDNIKLVLCGHEDVEDIITRTFQREGMSDVTAMLIDPQGLDRALGGTAIVTDLYFKELDNGTADITVRHYSTARQEYYGSAVNQFTTNISLVDKVTPTNTNNTISNMEFIHKVASTNPTLNDQIDAYYSGNVSVAAETLFSGKVIDMKDNTSLNITMQLGGDKRVYFYVPNCASPETFKIPKGTVFTSYDLNSTIQITEDIIVQTEVHLDLKQVDGDGWRFDSTYLVSAPEFYKISSATIDGKTGQTVRLQFFNWDGDRGAYIYPNGNYFPGNNLPTSELFIEKGAVLTQCDREGNEISNPKTMVLSDTIDVVLEGGSWVQQDLPKLIIGGPSTNTTAIEYGIKPGGTLPTGYCEDKYIIGWTVSGKTVTVYDDSIAIENYVPKFVDKKMLTIKAQDTYAASPVGTTEYDMRFIASVDCLNYSKVGMVFSLVNNEPTKDGAKCASRESKKVFENIRGGVTNKNYHVSDVYDAYSKYMFAFEITDIPASTTIYVRGYVELKDGTIVYGQTRKLIAPKAK